MVYVVRSKIKRGLKQGEADSWHSLYLRIWRIITSLSNLFHYFFYYYYHYVYVYYYYYSVVIIYFIIYCDVNNVSERLLFFFFFFYYYLLLLLSSSPLLLFWFSEKGNLGTEILWTATLIAFLPLSRHQFIENVG